MVVVAAPGLLIVAAPPETLVQAYAVMLPSGSEPLPVTVTELVGSVMVLSVPALAVGAWLGAAFTVTVTSSDPVAPALSVTVSLKM